MRVTAAVLFPGLNILQLPPPAAEPLAEGIPV
jgi:hypothetical protein